MAEVARMEQIGQTVTQRLQDNHDLSEEESRLVKDKIKVDRAGMQTIFEAALARKNQEKESIERNLAQKEAEIRNEVEQMHQRVEQLIEQRQDNARYVYKKLGLKGATEKACLVKYFESISEEQFE